MMPWNTACDVLELAVDHDVDNVRPAFLRAVRRTHPDRTGTSDSEAAFVRVIEANERLTTHRDNRDQPKVKPRTSDAPRSMGSLIAELLACLAEMAFADKQRNAIRPAFSRWDEDGIAYVEWRTVEWTGRSHYTETYTFTFNVTDEPYQYRELVRVLGEPAREKNAAWRERSPCGQKEQLSP
jgi:hypothetical protein